MPRYDAGDGRGSGAGAKQHTSSAVTVGLNMGGFSLDGPGPRGQFEPTRCGRHCPRAARRFRTWRPPASLQYKTKKEPHVYGYHGRYLRIDVGRGEAAFVELPESVLR